MSYECRMTITEIIAKEIVLIDRSTAIPEKIRKNSIQWLEICQKEVQNNSERKK